MKKLWISFMAICILSISCVISVEASEEVPAVIEETEVNMVSDDVVSMEVEETDTEKVGSAEDDFDYVIDGAEEYARITGYKGMYSDVIIPATLEGYPVKYVGGFENNLLIERVTVPEGIVELYDSTFYGCKNLTQVILPNSLRGIGEKCFAYCETLENIALPNGISEIKSNTFHGCINLSNIFIPDSIRTIGESAFYGCSKLQTVKIPENVDVIEPYTFSKCSELMDVSFPEGLTNISEGAFAYCVNLREITFPDSLQDIGYVAFRDTGFKELYFSENLKNIDDDAFGNCNDLKKITITGNTWIRWAFSGQNLRQMVFYGNPDISLYGLHKDTCFYGIINSNAYKYAKEKGYNFYKINAPVGLQVDNVDDSSVKLSWNAVNHVAGYKIYRSKSKENGYELIAATADNEFVDTGLKRDVYYYKVCVYYQNGDEVEGILTSPVKRDIKTLDNAVISYDIVAVHTGQEIKPVVDIRVGDTLLQEGIDYSLSYTDNINVGTATIVIEGMGQYYGTRTVIFEIIELSAPVLDKISAVAYNTISISWKPIENVSGYTIYRKMSGGEWKKIGQVNGDDSYIYKDKTVKPGFLYYYTVSANLITGDKTHTGAYDEPGLSAKTSFTKPVITSVKQSGDKTLKVSWKKVKGAQGYVIYRSTSKNGKYSKIKTITSGSTLGYSNVKLKSKSKYYYQIRAYSKYGDIYGYSAYSNKVSKTVNPYATPVLTSVKRAGAGKLKISWKKVSGITGYNIYRSNSRSGTYKRIKSVNKNVTSYTDSGLANNRKYYYKIRAYKKNVSKTEFSEYSDVKYYIASNIKFKKCTLYGFTNGGFYLEISRIGNNKLKFSISMPKASIFNEYAIVASSGKKAVCTYTCENGYKHKLTLSLISHGGIKVVENTKCFEQVLGWTDEQLAYDVISHKFYPESYIYPDNPDFM